MGVGIPSSVTSGSSALRVELGASCSLVSVHGPFAAWGDKGEEDYP